MRIALGTLLALVIAARPAAAQQAWADKMFKGEPLVHDFGSVPRGAQLFHRFKITNIYAVNMEIMRTHTSCGCVSVSTTVKSLKPHESGFVEVTMDARKFTSNRTVSIFVDVGPEFISTATLKVTANSRADIVFNPGEVNFGIVSKGQTPTQTIDVEYAGVLDWKVVEVVKNAAPFVTTLEESYRRPGQVGYRIKVTLNSDAPSGNLKHELFLRTNDPASPLVPILVEGVVQGGLSVVPATVRLERPKAGEEQVKRVVVRGSKPFRLIGISGQDGDIRVDLPSQAAAVHILTLHCTPRVPGEFQRQLVVKTDLGDEFPATIAIEGTVTP